MDRGTLVSEAAKEVVLFPCRENFAYRRLYDTLNDLCSRGEIAEWSHLVPRYEGKPTNCVLRIGFASKEDADVARSLNAGGGDD